LVAANLDKERGGTRAYIRYLRGLIAGRGRRGVLFLTELGRGRRSTRLKRVGKRVKLRNRRRVQIGLVGAHRWVHVAEVWVDGRFLYTAVCAHGLHRGTVGDRHADDWLDLLALYVASIDGPVRVGG